MQIEIRQYEQRDAAQAAEIWNEVVEDGKAFPQMEKLDEVTGHAFFTEQTYTGVAYDAATGELVGLYILHPNNVGRCGHICNASYAVKKSVRGQHIGEKLVKHCIAQGKTCGFRVLQFNAVVKSNTGALALYKKLGFTQLGVIPGGFLNKDANTRILSRITMFYKEKRRTPCFFAILICWMRILSASAGSTSA